MNLADMLSYADIDQLSRIASHYRCECSSHSKRELIQSILTTLGRKGWYDEMIHELSREDLGFMNSLLFDQRSLFSLEELIARAQQTKVNKQEEQWNPRDLISKFKQRGWLFNGHSQQTKYLFQMPNDLKQRFCDALNRHYQENLSACAEPNVYRDEQELLIHDILVFLTYIYHHEIPLTADELMYKRHVQQLLQQFSVIEEMLGKTGWRFGYGRRFRHYPDRFSLIYDYCYYNQLIEEDEQRMRLTADGERRVLARTREDPRQVYRLWVRLYKGAIPGLQVIVNWIERLAHTWIEVNQLKQILSNFIKPFYYDTVDSIFEQRILRMMLHLGLIAIGEEEHGKLLIRMNDSGSNIIRGIEVRDDEQIVLPYDVPETVQLKSSEIDT